MIRRWIVVAILLLPAASAQAPADVTLTLSSKDGRTQFRQGEAIELRLTFLSDAPGKYAVWQLDTERIARNAEYDKFSAEPVAGAVDALADGFYPVAGRGHVGPGPVPTPVDAAGVSVNLFLNEWISFRKPGHYRVTVETTRLVFKASEYHQTMKSSVFELEVTTFDAAWADARLKQAVSILEIPDPRGPRVPQMEAAWIAAENAARTLRFLETPAAARAIVQYLGHGPEFAQPQLRAAVESTPCRKDILAALDEVVAAPDIAITGDQYVALRNFAVLDQLGPMPPRSTSIDSVTWVRQVQIPYRERAQPFRDAVTARMITALAHKRGEALATSVATLGGNGPQLPSPALRKVLIENFAAMLPNTQHQWLNVYWPRIADPALGPALKMLATGSSDLRDDALVRLTELDPAAAWPIALDRIRRGDLNPEIYHNDRALLTLPDKTLPELDDALVGNVERRIPRADLLLARYASPAIEGRVNSFLDRQGICSGLLMTYLFRVDPESAVKRMAQSSGVRSCSPWGIQGSEDLLMSPGLEKELVRELDPAVSGAQQVGTVVGLLENGGSAAAKQPLVDTMQTPVDDARVNSFLNAVGWLPTAADFDKLLAICPSEPCRHEVNAARARFTEPVGISAQGSVFNMDYASIGPLKLRSPQQLKEKLAQFPKGTSFYVAVGYPGTWWAEQRQREFARMIADAGMKLAAERARAPLPH